MATQSQINASLGLPPGINPDGSWNAQDYMARRTPGQVDTQAQVDAARASAQAELMRGPGQSVTDASGREVQLTSYRPGFDPSNITTQIGLGELEARGGMDSTSQLFKQTATPAQLAANASAYAVELARLQEIDRVNALAAQSQPTGLLSGQPANLTGQVGQTTAVQAQTDPGTTRQAMGQAMETVGVKKTYTDAEMKQALRDLSWLEPNASVKDIISAAGTYGISKDKVIEHLSSFTYTTKNVDKLAQQILAQNTTATWKGDVKPATAARYMADELAKSGITDISQVGKGATGIINTETGQKLISGYGERTKGNLWSGTYEGGGNTGFGVQFTDSGKPIFYTEGASSSTLKKDLIKAAVVAAAAFGIFGPESLSSIYGSGAMVGEGLTAAEAFAAGLTPAQAAAAGLTAAELTAAGYTAAEIAGATVGATTVATGATAAEAAAAKAAADAAAVTAAGGLTASQLSTAARLGLTAAQFSGLLTSGGQTVAGLLQQQTSKEAADKARAMIDTETAAAKASAAFKPIGMTTRFGTSEFKTDPVTGQLTSAGYKLSPEAQYAQDFFRTQANLGLQQVELAPAVYAPLKTGANMMFDLGQQALNAPTDARLGQIATDYLTQSAGSKALQTLGEKYIAKSPEDVAADYLKSQMALLQPGRELELASLQNKLQQQGRLGLSVSQGGGLMPTSPELQALFNARTRQEAELAANAPLYGQQQVTFGAGLFDTGQKLGMQGQTFGMDVLAKQQALDQSRVGFGAGLYDLGSKSLGNYYGGLAQSYAPYNAAFGQMQALEAAGQQPFTLGAQLGQTAASAGAKVGQLGLMGAGQSVELATGKAATTNPYATALGGVTSNPLFTDALTKIAGGTPVNALDFGAYGSGNTGFQKMIDDIYG
jgi:hypothetical protein